MAGCRRCCSSRGCQAEEGGWRTFLVGIIWSCRSLQWSAFGRLKLKLQPNRRQNGTCLVSEAVTSGTSGQALLAAAAAAAKEEAKQEACDHSDVLDCIALSWQVLAAQEAVEKATASMAALRLLLNSCRPDESWQILLRLRHGFWSCRFRACLASIWWQAEALKAQFEKEKEQACVLCWEVEDASATFGGCGSSFGKSCPGQGAGASHKGFRTHPNKASTNVASSCCFGHVPCQVKKTSPRPWHDWPTMISSLCTISPGQASAALEETQAWGPGSAPLQVLLFMWPPRQPCWWRRKQQPSRRCRTCSKAGVC